MINSNRDVWLTLCAILLMMAVMGCEKPAEVPPPENAQAILQHVKDGYNNEDVELFTSDFADIMFSKGFTVEAWHDTMKKIKKNLGEWKSEIYLGKEDNAYTWRGTFEKGKVKCVIVLNEENRVSALWFR